MTHLSRLIALSLVLSACASTHTTVGSAVAPSPDPRLHLKAGWLNAGQAEWNMHLDAAERPAAAFFNPTGATEEVANTDLAFLGHYLVQGNFSGFQIWDIAKPTTPKVVTAYVCGGVQGDVSVYKNLLFVSVEENNARLDCGLQGVKDSVSTDRFRGIRIFDISDVLHPKQVADVQTCRGSHTNTLVTDPNDPGQVYIYVSALASTRSPSELAGCSDVAPEDNPETQRFRIDVIRVPVAHPEQAKIVSRPALLADLAPIDRHEEYAADTAGERMFLKLTKPSPEGEHAKKLSPLGPVVTTCHDITAYSAVGLAGGACIGYGLLIDIHDPANPRRIAAASDTNFWGWHSATFTNDGSQVLFTDEWGGGTLPRCRATDNPHWGGDAVYAISHDQLQLRGYYKLPVAQPDTKNCVAHNGSLIPVPGRNVMVQAWYQGGVSVFDFTDPANAKEIAYFDRGPVDSTKLEDGGTWSAYWYNGYIYSSEITRGLDVMHLEPSALLTQNEIDAANTVRLDDLNVQNQPRFVWPATFALARAYLDQLARDNGLPADQRAAAEKDLASAEKQQGDARHSTLKGLASRLDQAAAAASDPAKTRKLADAVKALAAT